MIADSVAKIIYVIGAKIRNPSLFKAYRELKKTESYNISELEKVQIDKLRELLIFASKYSPFYRNLFESNKINIESIKTLDEIKCIPVLEKRDLLENLEMISSQYEFKRVFPAETSGTSGDALEFNRNEEWDSSNRAALMRYYDWYDVKPWEYNGYLWGFNISGYEKFKVKVLDLLQNRIRLFSYDSSEIARFTRKLKKAKYINGYSSMIYEMARSINCAKDILMFDSIKLVKATSETVLDVYRKEVQDAFSIKLTSEYGAAESGLIGFECPYGKMHVNMENVILEINENNEAIITNLLSKSFPIIRYNLKDIIELEENTRCECGLEHAIIKNIIGRKGHTVYGKVKTYPALTFYYVFKNIALKNSVFLNYRANQYSKGFVVIEIEQDFSSKASELLENELRKYFSADIDFDIKWNASFYIEKTKKEQYFNSYIKVNG